MFVISILILLISAEQSSEAGCEQNGLKSGEF